MIKYNKQINYCKGDKMKLYYKGKYDLNPESLPHGNHKPGAVMFKEPKDSKTLSLLLTKISLIIIVVLGIIAIIRCKNYLTNSFWQSNLCRILQYFSDRIDNSIHQQDIRNEYKYI